MTDDRALLEAAMAQNTIEVICEDMQCFKVNARTLEPLGCSYYEPAALSDPRGPQMSWIEWTLRRNEQRDAVRFASLSRGERIEG